MKFSNLEEFHQQRCENLALRNSLLKKKPYLPKNGPLTIVCHDFKGGYLPSETSNQLSAYDPTHQDLVNYFEWTCFDIFIYFSHNRVSVPPLSWNLVCKRHGKPILGSILTENWQPLGIEDTDELSRATERNCAKLVQIAKDFYLDGWFVNIESGFKEPERQTREMCHFLSTLTHAMKKEIGPHALVLWYDSVITSGKLNWQNSLNEHNQVFFDNCDGIFLNYCYKDEHLQKSLTHCQKRKRDVYVGIDIFGRGTFGGGGMSTHIALELIKKYNFSAALFAPGWISEQSPSPNRLMVRFRSRQFWHGEEFEELLKISEPQQKWVTQELELREHKTKNLVQTAEAKDLFFSVMLKKRAASFPVQTAGYSAKFTFLDSQDQILCEAKTTADVCSTFEQSYEHLAVVHAPPNWTSLCTVESGSHVVVESPILVQSKEPRTLSKTCVASYCGKRPSITTLPFFTSFCTGEGNLFFEAGQTLSCRPWSSNLLQDPRPHLPLEGPVSLDTSGRAYEGNAVIKVRADWQGFVPLFDVNLQSSLPLSTLWATVITSAGFGKFKVVIESNFETKQRASLQYAFTKQIDHMWEQHWFRMAPNSFNLKCGTFSLGLAIARKKIAKGSSVSSWRQIGQFGMYDEKARIEQEASAKQHFGQLVKHATLVRQREQDQFNLQVQWKTSTEHHVLFFDVFVHGPRDRELHWLGRSYSHDFQIPSALAIKFDLLCVRPTDVYLKKHRFFLLEHRN